MVAFIDQQIDFSRRAKDASAIFPSVFELISKRVRKHVVFQKLREASFFKSREQGLTYVWPGLVEKKNRVA